MLEPAGFPGFHLEEVAPLAPGERGRRPSKTRPGYRSWMVWYLFLILSGILLAAVACNSSLDTASMGGAGAEAATQRTTLNVLAAVSLTEAFKDLAREYQLQNPEFEAILNFDGSQRLRTQLEHGAQADIFASADWAQVTALSDAGLVTGKPVNFAGNRLVILLNSESAAGLEAADVSDQLSPDLYSLALLAQLAKPDLKIVLALPEVPAGRYSELLLEQMENSPDLGPEIVEGIIANVVSREANVRSVAQKVALGEADAGITYATDALAAVVADKVKVVEMPEALGVEARYPIMATSIRGQDSGFIDFVLSDQGQSILAAHGFSRVSAENTSSP